jgi:hypothetical protein
MALHNYRTTEDFLHKIPSTVLFIKKILSLIFIDSSTRTGYKYIQRSPDEIAQEIASVDSCI